MKSINKGLTSIAKIVFLVLCAVGVYGFMAVLNGSPQNNPVENVINKEDRVSSMSPKTRSTTSTLAEKNTHNAKRKAHSEAVKVFSDAQKALTNGNCDRAEELVSLAITKTASTANYSQPSQSTGKQKNDPKKRVIQEMWAFLAEIAEARNENKCNDNTISGSVNRIAEGGNNEDTVQGVEQLAAKSFEQQIIAFLVKEKIRQMTYGNTGTPTRRRDITTTIADISEREPDKAESEFDKPVDDDGTVDDSEKPDDGWEDDPEVNEESEQEETTYVGCLRSPDLCHCLALNGYNIKQVFESPDFNQVWTIVMTESMLNCLSEQR
jgi:hypothetical protein